MRNPLRWQRRYQVVAVACVVVVVAVITVLMWPARKAPAIVVHNVSRNYRACLMVVTRDRGSAALAAATWQGLQAAAATGKVNAERFPVGSVEIGAALPYVNGAISQHCGVVVAAGGALVPALRIAAQNATHQQFLVVNGDLALPNIALVSDSDSAGVTAKVRSYVLARAAR